MTNDSQLIRKEYIYSGVLAGAESVSKNRELLNQANGFPVPDRDTGNNLSHLMHNILRELKAKDTIKTMLEEVSNLAIVGARGNSGAIFSQFFCGFSSSAPHADYMTIDDLLTCFEGGYAYAYRAISNPAEGTIITAIRSWVEALQREIPTQINLAAIYQRAYLSFRETVQQTQKTLAAQRHLQASDAGALAFLYFIEGFMKMLIDKVTDYRPQIDILTDVPSEIYHDETESLGTIAYQYCTEVLLNKNNHYDRAALEAHLQQLGDSLVLSESDQLARIHLHTNEPAEMIKSAYQMGEILENKADDMRAQSRLTRAHKGKIALVYDSIADIPADRLGEHCYLLPINILVGAVSYQDKVTAFSEIIKPGKASSAQPNTAQIKKFLEPIAKAYDDIIVITVSAKMSGLYERFKALLGEYKNIANIRLIDSKVNSVAEGLIVDNAIRLIKGGLSAAEIEKQLNALIKRTKIFVSVPNLKGMIASGRLDERLGRFLQHIGYLPLITIDGDGKGKVTGLAFSSAKNRKLFLKTAQQVKTEIVDYAIVHCDDEPAARQTANEMTAIIGKPPLYIDQISSVVKLFSGVGSVGVAYILGD